MRANAKKTISKLEPEIEFEKLVKLKTFLNNLN